MTDREKFDEMATALFEAETKIRLMRELLMMVTAAGLPCPDEFSLPEDQSIEGEFVSDLGMVVWRSASGEEFDEFLAFTQDDGTYGYEFSKKVGKSGRSGGEKESVRVGDVLEALKSWAA